MSVIKNLIDLLKWQPKKEYNFSISDAHSSQDNKDKLDDESSSNNSNNMKNSPTNDSQTLFTSLDKNLEYIKVKYNTLINSDIIIRDFILTARNKQYKAFLLYIDGMVDSKLINDFVLKPLMMKNAANSFEGEQDRIVSESVTNNITIRRVKKFDIIEYISSCLLPQNSVEKTKNFDEIIPGVNSGNCALFIDTVDTVFNIEVKGFKQRSVESPQNEVVIRGSQEAFTEVIRTNTSILRRLINNENLVIEDISVGKLSRTKCGICYMKNIANSDLVAEVKYRLNNIEIDYLISSGQLQQLIEDDSRYSLPQIIATERPDNASNYILEGRVAVIVNGSPYVLIMPATFPDFLSSSEDINLKFQFANLLKFIRILALLISLLLPGVYIAITTFHQELLPTELLFAIVSSKQNVPLPIILEIVVMELSFELIREASLRVPSPIGPTLGIIGALILGQAAVDANIVTPILIIIVSITGIASFAVPDFYMSFHFRIARFWYIFAGFFAGFLGIGITLFIHFLILTSIKSFGVYYLSPYLPAMSMNSKGYFLSPMWKREKRSDFLNTKRERKQQHISMQWKYHNEK